MSKDTRRSRPVTGTSNPPPLTNLASMYPFLPDDLKYGNKMPSTRQLFDAFIAKANEDPDQARVEAVPSSLRVARETFPRPPPPPMSQPRAASPTLQEKLEFYQDFNDYPSQPVNRFHHEERVKRFEHATGTSYQPHPAPAPQPPTGNPSHRKQGTSSKRASNDNVTQLVDRSRPATETSYPPPSAPASKPRKTGNPTHRRQATFAEKASTDDLSQPVNSFAPATETFYQPLPTPAPQPPIGSLSHRNQVTSAPGYKLPPEPVYWGGNWRPSPEPEPRCSPQAASKQVLFAKSAIDDYRSQPVDQEMLLKVHVGKDGLNISLIEKKWATEVQRLTKRTAPPSPSQDGSRKYAFYVRRPLEAAQGETEEEHMEREVELAKWMLDTWASYRPKGYGDVVVLLGQGMLGTFEKVKNHELSLN